MHLHAAKWAEFQERKDCIDKVVEFGHWQLLCIAKSLYSHQLYLAVLPSTGKALLESRTHRAAAPCAVDQRPESQFPALSPLSALSRWTSCGAQDAGVQANHLAGTSKP